MEQVFLKTISRHVKEKKITCSSQQRFSKGKSCLSNLISFYNEITVLMDERGAVDTVFPNF